MRHRMIHNKMSALVGLMVFAVLMVLPLVGLPKNIISLLTLSAIIGVVVLGMDILMGFAGLLSLGQAGFMAIGAYTSAILTVKHGFAPLTAMLLAQCLAVVVSIVIGKAVIRLKGYHLAIATMAFSVIVEQLLVNLLELTGGPSGFAGVPSLSVGGISVDGLPLYYLCVVVVLVVLLMLKNLTNCRVGRAWRAMAGDELAASCLGVNTDRYKLLAFAISASLAALSGSLYVHFMHFISPEMVGMQTSFNLVVMMSLGGAGTLIGPLLGATLLTFLPDLISFMKDFQLMINGLVLLVTMVFFPGGLFSLLTIPYRALGHWKSKGREELT
ncbi:MAG: branched-chain amino acid ABC transporter permease [Desulfitobacteriaceae bacterium]